MVKDISKLVLDTGRPIASVPRLSYHDLYRIADKLEKTAEEVAPHKVVVSSGEIWQGGIYDPLHDYQDINPRQFAAFLKWILDIPCIINKAPTKISILYTRLMQTFTLPKINGVPIIYKKCDRAGEIGILASSIFPAENYFSYCLSDIFNGDVSSYEISDSQFEKISFIHSPGQQIRRGDLVFIKRDMPYVIKKYRKSDVQADMQREDLKRRLEKRKKKIKNQQRINQLGRSQAQNHYKLKIDYARYLSFIELMSKKGIEWPILTLDAAERRELTEMEAIETRIYSSWPSLYVSLGTDKETGRVRVWKNPYSQPLYDPEDVAKVSRYAMPNVNVEEQTGELKLVERFRYNTVTRSQTEDTAPPLFIIPQKEHEQLRDLASRLICWQSSFRGVANEYQLRDSEMDTLIRFMELEVTKEKGRQRETIRGTIW